MNYIRKVCIIGAIVGTALYIYTKEPDIHISRRVNNPDTNEGYINVDTGEVGYSDGSRKLQSRFFTQCSALILDSGNKAVMAHALPDSRFSRYINTPKVVGNCVRYMRAHGVDPSRSEAILLAGKDLSGRTDVFESILEDLKKEGIKVRRAERHKGISRLIYDSVTDTLEVY